MKKIFLGYAEPDVLDNRTELFHILMKAGLQVIPKNISYENVILKSISDEINTADCALLVLGNQFGENIPDYQISITRYQYQECMRRCQSDYSFKLVIWHPAFFEFQELDHRQNEFIRKVRNEITHNVTFTNIASPIQLVADIRLSMEDTKLHDFAVRNSDIFLVHNELDELEAVGIADMLSDIIPVEKLNIIQDSDTDYSELCANQIKMSKLAVIYFKESAKWALPFVQQIWKKVGGASSNTPLLLIGDSEPETNSGIIFKAPKVVSLVIDGGLIPLEIKIQYDKVLDAKN